MGKPTERRIHIIEAKIAARGGFAQMGIEGAYSRVLRNRASWSDHELLGSALVDDWRYEVRERLPLSVVLSDGSSAPLYESLPLGPVDTLMSVFPHRGDRP